MPPLPAEMITVLGALAPLFSRPVWSHAQVLLVGALLCQGPRTVSAALRVLGLGQARGFVNYHRVLSRARWSGLQGAKIVLGLLVVLVPSNRLLIIVVDDTIERRSGRQIKAKGCYRDAVRSTPEGGGEVLWTEVDQHDATGALAVEFTGLGAALFDRAGAVEAGQCGGGQTP